jgi:uncharacterized membrane-anchored protein YitT (DUF2179 family)
MQAMLKKKIVREYLLIILGTTLLAAAINLFFEKHQLVTGGVTGLAIVIKHITKDYFNGGIPLWITNMVLNIPLFILGTILRGKVFGGKTLFSTFYLSFALYYTKFLPSIPTDLMLASLFGGVLAGIGLGFVFIGFATTGGTDLAASIIQYYIKHMSVAQIMMGLDALIIFSGFFIFGPTKAMYAVISVYITAKLVDSMLEGVHFSKAAFIISDQSARIAEEVMTRMDRGITGLEGRGMYTKNEKEVLLCVVSKKEIFQLREIVKEIDALAFVIVADVREVFGEGFIQHEL